MKNAIIIHGRPDKEEYYNPSVPSSSNWHWIPWLQKHLLLQEISCQTPEMFHSFDPDYALWTTEIERYTLNKETILVGHSCGAGFLVRYLSDRKDMQVGKVVLVAPWIDPDRESTTDFFDFTIDPDLAKRTKQLTIFHSDNDHDSVQKSVKILRGSITEINYHEFHKYGHFTIDSMPSSEFPELLQTVL